MMRREPPALHDEGISAFLADKDNGHAPLRSIDVEERSVLAEEPQLTLRDEIGSERLHVPRLGQRIRLEPSCRLLQHRSTLCSKGPQVIDYRLLQQNPPARHVPRLYQTRILVNPGSPLAVDHRRKCGLVGAASGETPAPPHPALSPNRGEGYGEARALRR